MTSTTNEIRSIFLDYFADRGHEVVPSSQLVPQNDPTLLFTNAGMVQFKNVFTGLETRPYVRAATSQKCVRAGGKHNDLENVGYTARHHTFFEMLGNFSFGDYFKDVAIENAWDLVTRELNLSKEKLLVTVYSEDHEAFNLWKKIAGLPEDRIIRISTVDNFWSMGDTGPCGPCSEIFYDHGEMIPGGPPGSQDEDGDRFIEIWNLVFMQFEQVDLETRENLPKPSIDTGMGLERIAAVLQGKQNNYDIDLIRGLVEASAKATGTEPDGEYQASHRVISDHLRASSFLIADGVLPSNEGRGYVLRRIMRRAMRHAHIMGCEDPLLWRLFPALVDQMGMAFPELEQAGSHITEILKLEEVRFRETLDRGLRLLAEETVKLGEGEPLGGDVAFKLYDTYGFPLDLTADVLRGQGRSVDIATFNKAMERQRTEARKNWVGASSGMDDRIWFTIRERIGATEFTGYKLEPIDAVVVAIVSDGIEVVTANPGQEVQVVTNQTPFYPESGGQQGDTGSFSGTDLNVEIIDTQKKAGDLYVHSAKIITGDLRTGLTVKLTVCEERRTELRAHHSATHLLHEALRRQLGDHVVQKGSLVAPDRLRFDITHPKPIAGEDLRAVQTEVNFRIRLNTEVNTVLMTPDEAVSIGATALFGEKYGEEVRVVSMGAGDGKFSVELCGGTHVERTGEIGFFHIMGESAVAAGIRRIEAVAGRAVETHISKLNDLLLSASNKLNITPENLPDRVTGLVNERRKLEGELSNLRKKLATGESTGAGSSAVKNINGINFTTRILTEVPAKELKSLADELKHQLVSGVVAIISVEAEKASIVVGVTDDITSQINAVNLVKVGSQALGGKGGGGRADLAQAGGPNGSAAADALNAIEHAVAQAKKPE